MFLGSPRGIPPLMLQRDLIDLANLKDISHGVFYLYMLERYSLIHSTTCPKCRTIGWVVRHLDIFRRFNTYSLTGDIGKRILAEYYDDPPYSYFLIDNDKETCYSGTKAILPILKGLVGL